MATYHPLTNWIQAPEVFNKTSILLKIPDDQHHEESNQASSFSFLFPLLGVKGCLLSSLMRGISCWLTNSNSTWLEMASRMTSFAYSRSQGVSCSTSSGTVPLSMLDTDQNYQIDVPAQYQSYNPQMEVYALFFCVPFLLFFWTVVHYLVYACVHTLTPKMADPPKLQIIYRAFKAVHGIMAFLLNAEGTWKTLNSSQLPQSWTQLVILFSITFYTFDSIVGHNIGIEYKLMHHHHLITVVLMIGTLFHQDNYLYFPTLVLLEVSNGPQHARQIIKILGLRFTKLFDLVEGLFVYSFLIARAAFCPLMIYIMLAIKRASIFLYLSASLLILISNHFWLQVYRKVKIRRQQQQEMRQKGVEYGWLQSDHQKLKLLSFYYQSYTHDI